MKQFDVFNGDADGICALHQLRMAVPAQGELITGVKRDIMLLGRVPAQAGDQVTVLDISLDSNRADLGRLLAAGARVRWFDHHFDGELPKHAGLEAHIDTSAEVCTSVLVDRFLNGRFRAWAIVAAFGDGLPAVAWKLATAMGLNQPNAMALAWLGECLNYNAYGESVADLWFPPDMVYRAVHEYAEPLAFVRESPVFTRLDAGFREDMAKAQALRPHLETPHGAVLVLPDEAWARRAIGVYANQLAQANPQRAHALLSPNSGGGYTVSVRAPVARPSGADVLCRGFATGGGRTGAAGINRLPEADFERFVQAFGAAFQP
jgi:hypothetical protein